MRIEDMSIDQLLEMNRVICRRIDQLQDQENIQALSQLRVGSKVTFGGREGPKVGIVTKINRKSVIVLAEDDGMKQYKVSPGLLRPLRDVK
jgi:preprotein translocase subunit YajC